MCQEGASACQRAAGRNSGFRMSANLKLRVGYNGQDLGDSPLILVTPDACQLLLRARSIHSGATQKHASGFVEKRAHSWQ
jgi:hypothetical protein